MIIGGEKRGWSGKSTSIEGAFYPIFLRVIKYSTRGSRGAAGTGGRGTIVAGVAGRTRGIMGSNDEKPEGLYQWELAAVCPSNGTQAPPTMPDNAPEEPMVNRPIASLSLALSSARNSVSLSVLVAATLGVLMLLSSSMVSEPLARVQLPEKCRHPRSCVSPSRSRSRSIFLRPFPSRLPGFISFSLLGQLTSRPPPTLLWSTQY